MWQQKKRVITNHRRQYPHGNTPHHPSGKCRQHLSPAQLEEITQNNRMARFSRKQERVLATA